MSGATHDSYTRHFRTVKSAISATDPKERARGEEERLGRLFAARATVAEKTERVQRDESGLYDKSLVRLGISQPAPSTATVHIILTDNSGSNRAIADHMKRSSGYTTGVVQVISPGSELAHNYFSDHCDGREGLMQEVDYVSPDKTGDRILYSSLAHVRNAHGGDEAEAIECALWRACEYGFGSAKRRHLYLITDVVAHGMGLASDDGCPEQRDWRASLRRVRETFTTFQVVGCGADRRVGDLQKQFLIPERVPFDLIDLSGIEQPRYRLGITVNALLFLIARNEGKQAVEAFLSGLYEKWLSDPLFGANTDLAAKEAIRRFGKYLEAPQAEVSALMTKILG